MTTAPRDAIVDKEGTDLPRAMLAPVRSSDRLDQNASQRARVRAYYTHTWYEFRGLWMNADNRSLHFGYWDRSIKNHPASLTRMREELARRCEVRPADVCLDAGCGVGGTAMWLAKTHRARVIAVTIVPDQARRVRRYAAVRNLESLVQSVEGDFHSLGLRSGSVDVAYSQEAICHATDKRGVLAELVRVVRPGGRIVLAEYFLSHPPQTDRERQLMDAWLADWMMPNLVTAEEFKGWAEELGLVDAAINDLTPFVARSLRRLHRISSILYPIESSLHRARLRSDVQHGNIRGSVLQWKAAQQDLWLYGVFSARRR
jgi:tocopherol O-methyltransferase